MRPPSFRTAAFALAILTLLGTAGCGTPAATYHSGQIGRFYGEGVSFSVPLVSLAEKAGGEDRYWELRRGIGQSVVVAFSPVAPGGDEFRENLVLTAQDLDRAMTAVEFRELQVQQFQQEGTLTGQPTLGEDATGPWAEFPTKEEDRPVRCRAWFFVRPLEQGGKPRGYVLMGTAEAGGTADSYMDQFAAIAATVRFSRPPTGFSLLGKAVDDVLAAAAAVRGSAPAPGLAPSGAAPAPSGAASPVAVPAPAEALPASPAPAAAGVSPAPAASPLR